MRRDLFQPAPAGEARLLLLINAFSDQEAGLEGRTKLAKLDFLLRYPAFFRRALARRAPAALVPADDEPEEDLIETPMVRFRYGPWDPSYFALLGSLIGRGLVVPVPAAKGIGYRTTPRGRQIANKLAADPSWMPVASRARLLGRHFNLTGARLKTFIYETFPEVTSAAWGARL